MPPRIHTPSQSTTSASRWGKGSPAGSPRSVRPSRSRRERCATSAFGVSASCTEDSFEAFLSVPILAGGRLIGVLNLQHRKRHAHSPQEVKLVSTIGHLVGAEIERARLDSEVTKLTGQLETRKLLERAKGILQRDLGLTEEQAYLKLQQESRRRRIPMKQVAEAVVLSDDLRRAHRGS